MSDRVSGVTAPEEASLRAGLGVSCRVGGPGNSGAPALLVLTLVVEHFRDLSSAFHSVTEWRREGLRAPTSLGRPAGLEREHEVEVFIKTARPHEFARGGQGPPYG